MFRTWCSPNILKHSYNIHNDFQSFYSSCLTTHRIWRERASRRLSRWVTLRSLRHFSKNHHSKIKRIQKLFNSIELKKKSFMPWLHRNFSALNRWHLWPCCIICSAVARVWLFLLAFRGKQWPMRDLDIDAQLASKSLQAIEDLCDAQSQ